MLNNLNISDIYKHCYFRARQARKQEQPSSSPNLASEEADPKDFPSELCCPLCNGLLREAVLATCCGDSFCAECMQQKMLEDSQQM